MLGIVLRALRRRRMHAATLFLLGLIAATAAAAAPGYASAGAENLAAAELSEASAAEHLVSVQGDVTLSGPLDARFRDLDASVGRAVDLPGFELFDDARLAGHVGDVRASLVYREGVCDRLTIVGACPTRPGEVALASDMVRILHAPVGTTFSFGDTDLPDPVTLTVVGVYRASQPTDAYWGESSTADDGTVTGLRDPSGTMFTPVSTFVAARPQRVEATLDFLATAAAVRARNPQTLALSFEQATPSLGAQNLSVSSRFRAYADRSLDETNFIYIGVAAATAQLLILVWFALALAVRQTAQVRRPDVGLMKLRGVGRRSLWGLVAGQAVVPIVVGGAVGLVVGAVGVRAWTGPVADPAAARLLLVTTVAAAAVAVLIALAAALTAERRMLAEPVADLNRGVPARSRGWRAGILDAAVIALALAAAVELRSSAIDTAQFRGLDVLAPTLVALAVGVIAAWTVPRLAQLVATPSLRVGRVGTGLTAVHLARRTSLPRVLAMLTLAVAVVTGATISWGVATTTQRVRAGVELGADRVLTVQTTGSTALLTAVRAADPEGRYAMAVVRSLSGTPTLAVDASRLAAVVPWFQAYGLPNWTTVARELTAGSRPAITVHSGALSVDAVWSPAGSAVTAQLAAVVQRTDGSTAAVSFGNLRRASATYGASVTGCDPQCRLVGFTLTGGAGLAGSSLTLRQLSAGAAAVVAPAAFADRTRWRTSIVAGDNLPTLTSGPTGLAVRVDQSADSAVATYPVYVDDAVLPLPTIAAGPAGPDLLIGSASVTVPGGGVVPARVVGSATLLPRIGSAGRLVDLATLDRVQPGTGLLEVWLAPGTPDSVVAALRDHGLSIVDDESAAGRLTQLRAQGPAVALAYLLAVAVVGFVLAVGAFALAAAVERPVRAEELAALRRQGLRPGAVARVAYGGYLSFAVVAVGLGVLTALLAGRIIGPPRVFGDGWAVVAEPGLGPTGLGLIVGGVVVVAGLTAVLASAALTRAVRGPRP